MCGPAESLRARGAVLVTTIGVHTTPGGRIHLSSGITI